MQAIDQVRDYRKIWKQNCTTDDKIHFLATEEYNESLCSTNQNKKKKKRANLIQIQQSKQRDGPSKQLLVRDDGRRLIFNRAGQYHNSVQLFFNTSI